MMDCNIISIVILAHVWTEISDRTVHTSTEKEEMREDKALKDKNHTVFRLCRKQVWFLQNTILEILIDRQ